MSVTARDVRTCLSVPDAHFHLMGIGGVGMAGVAELLRLRGITASGCDVLHSARTEWLRKNGINVLEGHDPGHLDGTVTAVVYSSAVPGSSLELLRAKELGLAVMRRGQLLAALMEGKVSVAVSGTHGKTTTTAFIAEMLKDGEDGFAWAIGSESSSLSGVAGSSIAGEGGDESIIVVEADESDGTLVEYHPDIAVVTNVEFDHMEHFVGREEFETCFRSFVSQAKRAVIYCADDEVAGDLATSAEQRGNVKRISYGLAKDAEIRACEIDYQSDCSRFKVMIDGQESGEVNLPVPGQHNVINACAAFAVGRELGIEQEAIIAALSRVRLPARRFEKVCENRGIAVISDYAHHPTEISALVQTAQGQGRERLLMIYQPHRYSRTRTLAREFPASFDGLDQLVLVPVYAASEELIQGGRIHDLYAEFRSQGSTVVPMLASSPMQAWEYFETQLEFGDMCMVTGAGDVDQVVENARDYVEKNDAPSLESMTEDLRTRLGETAVVKCCEPVGPKTSWGVGGAADLWVELDCEDDLASAMKWSASQQLRFRILGAGSNVLVSDLGLRGVTCRLAGAFNAVDEVDGVVRVGAGTPVSKLLNLMEERSLSGMEFMEGIPGTVGGALRMNAGAHGKTVGEFVRSIRCLRPDGSCAKVERKDLLWEYRSCVSLQGSWVISVDLDLIAGDKSRVRETRELFAAKRSWFKGLRCAGSVFKNPGDDTGPAGKLLDDAGLKGLKVGGACVSDQHANVIVTEKGATASDVKALIGILQDKIRAERGVSLELEVVELV